MFFPEDQAKEKWCPNSIVRFGSVEVAESRSSSDTVHSATTCVGFRCMMWRWEDDNDFMERSSSDGTAMRCGFCGLAGVPINKPQRV
jgi:hypothetical protein